MLNEVYRLCKSDFSGINKERTQMDRCANTEALNKYLSGEEQFEKVCEEFEGDVLQLIQELRSITRDYKYYDMTDVLKEILPDMILEELNIQL